MPDYIVYIFMEWLEPLTGNGWHHRLDNNIIINKVNKLKYY